jgi:murein L,D-transpeptidase YcbB/YkuD
MKVIVGKKERPTPILNSTISYAVLNPSWTAPETIVREDIIEKGNIDSYLAKHNMKVYMTLHGESVEVNSNHIDWKSYEGQSNIPYTFKADSGTLNPLGVVKFIFNNQYSVYMHDTNRRDLFQNEYRALSSGCVRLNEPNKLLTYLLEKEGKILSKVKNSKEVTDTIVSLRGKVPVVFRYMTVGVDKDHKINFYDDIYGYDDLILPISNNESETLTMGQR